jgi:DNA sulfur modification protein DndE
MYQRIHLSAEADEALTVIQQVLGGDAAEIKAIASLAFFYSLSLDPVPRPDTASDNRTGREIMRIAFPGKLEPVVRAVLALVYKQPMDDEETLKNLIKINVDNGLKMLAGECEKVGRNRDAFLAHLSAGVKKYPGTLGAFREARSLIGETTEGEKVWICLNNPNEQLNPHIALIGSTGCGKTQTLLKIVADVAKESPNLGLVIFDYKGDISANSTFTHICGLEVVRPGGRENESIPVNPLELEDYEERTVDWACEGLTETLTLFDPHIGTVQKGLLRRALKVAYSRAAESGKGAPDFLDVLASLDEVYAEQGKPPIDSLFEAVRKMGRFGFFASSDGRGPAREKFWAWRGVIDLSSLEGLREVVAFVTLNHIYRQIRRLPDAPEQQGTGVRELRCIIAIDEAHHYLPKDPGPLKNLIREGRSKGVAILLSSQSVDDYRRSGDFDYSELLGNLFIFKTSKGTPGIIKELLRCSDKEARGVYKELANLPVGHCFCSGVKGKSLSHPPVSLKVVSFAEAYG